MNVPSSSQLTAILFADIRGYTAFMKQYEKWAFQLQQTYQETLKKNVPVRYGGLIKNYSERSICLFPTAIGEVACAKSIQEKLHKNPFFSLRLGLHHGAVIHTVDDVYGDASNITSHIETMGIPGNILVSRSIYQKVKNLPEQEFTLLDTFEFKHVDDPIKVLTACNRNKCMKKLKKL